MIKSHNLKLYPNKQKAKSINQLLDFYHKEVNKKISIFWKMKTVKGSYCPTGYARGEKLINDASKKAWQIVKGARATKQKKKPFYCFGEIDLNEFSARQIEDLSTIEFDVWFKMINLKKYHRVALPAKKTKVLNNALKTGKLRKSFKLKVKGKGKHRQYYMAVFVEMPEPEKRNNQKKLGIDVGLDNPIVTSDGQLIGQDLKDLRVRTKWRTYDGKISPYKQVLNSEVKQLIGSNPATDFIVEDLHFQGKKNRSRKFRRNNKNWAYKHVAKQLEQHSILEGFQVFAVNPTNTSIQCSVCGFTSKANRIGSIFRCLQCQHTNHADINAAINIRNQYERVAWEPMSP